MADSISMLFDYRQEADYDLDADITKEEAEMLIAKATEIHTLCYNYFQGLVNDTLTK